MGKTFSVFLFVLLSMPLVFAQCIQQCEDERVACADESPFGFSYLNLSKTISTQPLDSPDFFSLTDVRLCHELKCNDARDVCSAWAVNFGFKSCMEACREAGCNSTVACTLQMRQEFTKCDLAYIDCCRNSTAKKCEPALVECKKNCPPETFVVEQKCSSECPPGEAQRPFPDCSCVSPPSAAVCAFEGVVEAKKSASPSWHALSVSELLSRGDSIRTGDGMAELSFGESCSKPLVSLKPNSSMTVWDYSESNESKSQVVLVSSGAVKVLGENSFLVHARAFTGWFSVKSLESDYVLEASPYSANVKVLSGSVEVSKPNGENASASAGTEVFVFQTKNISTTSFNVEKELESWKPKKRVENNLLLYAGVLVVITVLAAAYWFFLRKRGEETY